MDRNRKDNVGADYRKQAFSNESADNRRIAIGFVTLFISAFLALGVRSLLPDLNPLILIALGVTTYGVYLSTLLLTHLSQVKKEQGSLKTVDVKVSDNRLN